MDLPKVIAHRGASFFAPENTLSALRAAHAHGVQWVECDVLLTQDHVPIIFHDANLKRITQYNKTVAQTPFEKIKELDAGLWFGEKYRHEKIPTLFEWLECAANLEMGINLEIKVSRKAELDLLVDQVSSALQTYWAAKLPTPIISSFHLSALEVFSNRQGNFSLAWLTDHWNKNIPAVLDRYQCVSWNTHYHCLTPERIQIVHEQNRKVLAYTIDDLRMANYFWNIGVDSIFSNNLLLES